MRRKSIRMLAVAALTTVALSPSAEGKLAKLTSATWTSGGRTAGVASAQRSNRNRNLTVNLTGKATIPASVRLEAFLMFDTKKGNDVATIIVSSKPNLVQVSGTPSGRPNSQGLIPYGVSLKGSELKALTGETTEAITLNDPFGGEFKLNLRIVPYDGPNYVTEIGVPSLVRPGNLVNFHVRLQEPAADVLVPGVKGGRGQELTWLLIPADCFVAAAGSVPYSSTRFNRLAVPPGQIETNFSVVAVNQQDTCDGTDRKIEVWHGKDTNARSAPAYRFATFAISSQ